MTIKISFSFLKKDFIYLFLYRGKGRENERERNITMCGCLSHAPSWGPGPHTTQACALTGN